VRLFHFCVIEEDIMQLENTENASAMLNATSSLTTKPVKAEEVQLKGRVMDSAMQTAKEVVAQKNDLTQVKDFAQIQAEAEQQNTLGLRPDQQAGVAGFDIRI
jgi:hypothetical protein